jgi:hypothetical protein
LSILNSEPEKFIRVVDEEFLEVEADQALKAKQFDKSRMFALKQDVGFHCISNSSPAEAVGLQIDNLAVKRVLQ